MRSLFARRTGAFLLLAWGWMACGAEDDVPLYRTVPVERRDIIVGAEAAGLVEPQLAVEVKSKASGEILELAVDTGDRVDQGTLLVRVDQRQPSNALALAQAELEAAQSRLAIARDQSERARRLFEAASIPETQYEQARLEAANAKADIVRARVAVENAQIQMDDTKVTAPIGGTVIEKNVERGQVISSPTQDVSGGTVLLRMADLTVVQVRTLVDETDIGKIREGVTARVEVSAYPDRSFEGQVVKIEPQAIVEQNVTMFPVRVQLVNRDGLLRPGMNANVDIRVSERSAVLAVPNAALVAPGDADLMAGLLAVEPLPPADTDRPSAVQAGEDVRTTATARARGGPPEGSRSPTAPGRPTSPGPATRGGGEGPTWSPDSAPGAGDEGARGALHVVFVMRGGVPEPVRIRTGVTDLDSSEVLSGLEEGDQVLLLPSAELVRSQERFRERMERFTGGGLPGLRGRSR